MYSLRQFLSELRIGLVAKSPSAHRHRPFIWLEMSSISLTSAAVAFLSQIASMRFSSQYVPSRHGVHLPQLSCLKKWITFRAAHTMSTVSSRRITDADPRIEP